MKNTATQTEGGPLRGGRFYRGHPVYRLHCDPNCEKRTKKGGQVPKWLEVRSVERIENATVFERYVRRRYEVEAKIKLVETFGAFEQVVGNSKQQKRVLFVYLSRKRWGGRVRANGKIGEALSCT